MILVLSALEKFKNRNIKPIFKSLYFIQLEILYDKSESKESGIGLCAHTLMISQPFPMEICKLYM